MDLFEIVNGYAYPSVHALMIEPFKSMWENDTSEGKNKCLKDFTYIELLCSPKKSNPYHGESTDVRPSKVKKEVYKDENYPTTDTVVMATMKYIELLKISSPSYGLYQDAVGGLERNREWLRTFDLNERTPHGAMVLKPKDVNSAIKEIPDIMIKLEDTRTRMLQELSQDSKTRNERKVGAYER